MTLTEAVRTYLLTLSAVTTITSVVRPGRLNQGDHLPAIVIYIDEEEDANDLNGLGGLTYANMTIAAISSNYSQAWALSDAIKTNGTNPGTGLAGYSGLAGTLDIDAVHNQRSSVYAPLPDGSEDGVHAIESVYQISYSATA